MKKLFYAALLYVFLPCLIWAGPNTITTLTVGNQTFSVFTVDLKTQSLGLYWKNDAGKIYSNFNDLEAGLKKRGLRLDFATNAGIYEEGDIPTGLLMVGDETILPLNLNPGQGNFFLKPNGVFLVSHGKPYVMTSEAWLRFKHPIDLATQSGPMLVIDGHIHPAFTQGSSSKYIRSGVGVNTKGLVSFLISNQPVNFYDFAKVFQENLGCKNALYLDGSISKFYSPNPRRAPRARENFAAFFAVTSPL